MIQNNIEIQNKRGTAARWELVNPVLLAGEIGYETDTGKSKLGDGISHWVDLIYATNSGESLLTFRDSDDNSFNDISEIQVNGASLGKNPKNVKQLTITVDDNSKSLKISDENTQALDCDNIKVGKGLKLENNNGVFIISISDIQPEPTKDIKVYYGFSKSETSTEAEAKAMKSEMVENVLGSIFKDTQTEGENPQYFYIIIPTSKIDEVHTIGHTGSIGANWDNRNIVLIDGVSYTAIRNNNEIWDTSVSFQIY